MIKKGILLGKDCWKMLMIKRIIMSYFLEEKDNINEINYLLKVNLLLNL